MFTNEINTISHDALTMTSIEIAKVIGKQHCHVLRDIEDEKSKISDICTESIFGFCTYKDSTGRKLPMYSLTKKGIMQLGARYDAKVRYRLITKLEEMEQRNIQALPRNYIEALRALVASEEHRQQLTIEHSVMIPKAEYYDELVDRNLLTTFRETAKELQTKERDFINWLLSRKFIYRDGRDKLMPYAKNNGLFEVKERISRNTSWAGTQTLITPKGRETFLRLYNNN